MNVGKEKRRPVGVMDSGIGGMSVLCELRKQMPGEDFLYLGDTANAPYGEKSAEEVLRLTRENVRLLRSRGARAVVIACNTATAVAVATLRAEWEDFPLVGIEPALRPASLLSEHPSVLVMATPLTLAGEKYRLLQEALSASCDFVPLPCPGLAELIESGEWDTPRLHAALDKLLAPHEGRAFDAVVLGCTHYPLIRRAIAARFPAGTPILDGGAGTARQTARRLAEQGDLLPPGRAGRVDFIFTDPATAAGKTELCRRLLLQYE